MAIRNRLIDYRDGDLVFEGRLAWDDPMSTLDNVMARSRELTAMQNFLDELFNGQQARE